MTEPFCERCKTNTHPDAYQLVASFSADLCHPCFRDWVVLYSKNPWADIIETVLEKQAVVKGRLSTLGSMPSSVLTAPQEKKIEDLVLRLRHARLELTKVCEAWLLTPPAPRAAAAPMGFAAGRK